MDWWIWVGLVFFGFFGPIIAVMAFVENLKARRAWRDHMHEWAKRMEREEKQQASGQEE